MIEFINLHFSSEYSFFESPTKIKDYVEYGNKLGLKSLVLTDHNYVFGFAEFRKWCDHYNIKPIFGLDLDVEDFRLILIAKNNYGFQEIKNFSLKKSRNEEIKLNNISDENLFIINHPNYGHKEPELLLKIFNDFYFYQPENAKSNIFINDNRIIDLKQENSLFFINDLRGEKLDEFKSYLFSFEYQNIHENLKINTQKIAENANVVFDKGKKNTLPLFSENPKQTLRKLIDTNKSQIPRLKKYNDEVVEKRINYELSVIEKMNVENYFLLIADLINWSRKNNILIGPGRGSVSGSLIAYILGITQINPLEFNLYFERFLNEERISMPDIDIDIQDDERDRVIHYLKTKYGFENVAQICTFQRMGAKQSLKDAGRYLELPFSEINDISKLISGNDELLYSYENNVKFKARINSTEEFKKMFDLAVMIESLPRQTGIHAAGVVISKSSIIDLIPIFDVDNNLVSQFSMEYLEDWNLLKIDLLGLRTLTIIKEIEKEINQNFDPKFSINDIPLNDEKTNKLLSSSKVAGIFQLESPGMMKTIKNVSINKFEDLVDIISLYRPGPLSNIPKYIENKNNPNLIKKVSKEYDEVVNKTHGIIIYQEQIMEIVQKVAGLSFAQADILRRSISKKDKTDMEKMEKIFVENASKKGVSLSEASDIFNEIKKFAEYGFNKSHAVAYATLSYKMAYLKTKFPICFYSVLISLTASMESVNKYVLEAKELKFNIESPLINKISNKIEHDKKNTIFLPLTFIKGFGFAALEKLLFEFNNYGIFINFYNFVARAKRAGVGDSILEILIKSNTLREFGNMTTLLNNLDKALNYANVIAWEDKATKKIMLDFNTKAPQLEYFEQDLKLESKNEIKYLGMIYNSFITSKYETKDKLINLKVGIEYNIALLINQKKQVINKYNKFSYILEVSDSTSRETIFFNEKNKNIFDEIQENEIGYANILKLDRNGKTYFLISKWKKINSA